MNNATVCSRYDESKQLACLYSLLYPGKSYQEFCERTNSSSKLDIRIHYDPAPLDEPDFPLRQFLWFFRPTANFWAFTNAIDSWDRICEIGKSSQDLGLVPWAGLQETVHRIEHAITQYQLKNKDPDGIFEGCNRPRKSSQVNKSLEIDQPENGLEEIRSGGNPLLGKGISSFPLFAMVLTNPRNKDLTELNPFSRKIDHWSVLLTYIYWHQHKVYESDLKAEDKKDMSWGPYQFLSLEVEKAWGVGTLNQLERSLRRLSLGWERAPSINLINALNKSTYFQFRRYCQEWLKELESPKPLRIANFKEIMRVLRYFSDVKHPRLLKRHSRGSGEDNPGIHYWRAIPATPNYEEDIESHSINIYQLNPDLSGGNIREAEEVSEEPAEYVTDSPEYSLLFKDFGPASQLILDRHTSYSQLLLASNNQQLWWDQKRLTHAEVSRLMEFLTSRIKESSDRLRLDELESGANAKNELDQLKIQACLALKVVILLGVDLEMALNLEVLSIKSPHQLRKINQLQIRAKDKAKLGTVKDPMDSIPLRLCMVKSANPTYFWVYPIPVRSLHLLANGYSPQYVKYHAHTSTIIFHDQSGIAQDLMLKAGLAEGIAAVFADDIKIRLGPICKELLSSFNIRENRKSFEIDVTQLMIQEGKRQVSIEKLRHYSWTHLRRMGVDSTLVDVLNWKVPQGKVPPLFYFTYQLGLPAEQWKRLQSQLSSRTGMFQDRYQADPQKDFKDESLSSDWGLQRLDSQFIGAPGLPHSNWVIDKIRVLKEEISHHSRQTSVKTQKEFQQFIDSLNAYSLYLALWFCAETSHRPHHITFVENNAVDPLLGFVVLKDKSNRYGDKFRLAWVSKPLRLAMHKYADQLIKLKARAVAIGLPYSAELLAYFDMGQIDNFLAEGNYSTGIQTLDSKIFGKEIEGRFKLEPNFYRKFISHLLRQPELKDPSLFRDTEDPEVRLEFATQPLPQHDVETWLGHNQLGTAPYHRFGTASSIEYSQRIQGRLTEVMKLLGFEIVPFCVPWLRWSGKDVP